MFIRWTGLDEAAGYELIGTEQVFGGDELMYAGVKIPTGPLAF
ncbi:hypothetical protein HB852_11795 [Listeria grandensis]|nr:GH36 C-terminal domain-containing protein [Listeria grandensis]MBC1475296.1 hypothetical protein [Listeria grandensis]